MGIADINMIPRISEAYRTCAYITRVRVETDWGEILCNNLPEDESQTLIRVEGIRQSYRLCNLDIFDVVRPCCSNTRLGAAEPNCGKSAALRREPKPAPVTGHSASALCAGRTHR
jgi:hypothetical protein